MITVRVPTPLRTLTAGKEEVAVEGLTVAQVLANLETQHPGMKGRVRDDAGKLRRFINLFLNEDDVRTLKGLESEVKAGDVLSIIPAIAGGR